MSKDAAAADDSSESTLVLLAEFYDSGGTRTYLKQLLNFYAESGFRIILVGCYSAPDPEIADILKSHSFGYESYFDILHGVSSKQTSSQKRVPKVWSLAYMSRERTAFRDFLSKSGAQGIVVSAGTPGLFAGAAGAFESGIYILHTYPHGRRQKYLARFVMKSFFRKVKKLVAVSQFQKEQMQRLWGVSGGDERIEVVRNSAGPVLGARTRFIPAGRQVITASWVEKYKNPDFWIATALLASQELGKEQIQFTWFGEGSLLETSRKRVSSIAESAHAEFVGHEEHLEDHYDSAFAYLQTSSVENMSLSVIEALRFGLPSIVTDVGGLPEIIENGVTGFVVPPDSPQLAAVALARLVHEPDLWLQMSQAAEARYAEFFVDEAWKTAMASLHLNVFGNLNHD